MSYYAKVLDGKVITVISAEAEFFKTFIDTSPGTWLQTSYNTRGNVHYGQDGLPDGLPALRGNYAGIGYNYDHVNDIFYPPKPYPSWVLSEQTWTWEAPVSCPTDGKQYAWDEENKNWVESNMILDTTISLS